MSLTCQPNDRLVKTIFIAVTLEICVGTSLPWPINSIDLVASKGIAINSIFYNPYSSQAKTAASEADTDRVLQYLDDKGLSRLAILHQLKRLSLELDSRKRNKIAVELADRYREYFFSNFDETSANEFIDRADWLSKTYPAINQPNFRLAISHAKYIQAERQFRRWWQSSAPASGLDAIVDRFKDLEREIAAQLRTDESRQRQLISQIAIEPSLRQKQQELIDQIEVRLLHGHYLYAWTSYFLAILSAETSQPLLNQARLSFYRALRIEQPAPIEQIDPKWLDFSPPIAGRALLGLAAVYTALDRNTSASFCFNKAEEIAAPQFNRSVLEFNALVHSRKWKAAVEHAKTKYPDDSSQRAAFWYAVANAGYSTNRERAELRVLRQIGLLGLAREFDFEKLRQFAVTEELDFDAASYERNWIEALVQFHISESSDLGFATALNQIVTLIDSDLQTIPSSDLARMRCIAGLMHYKRGELGQADRQIKKIDKEELARDRQLAQRLDWLNVLVQLRRALADPVQQAHAFEAINKFVDQYPYSQMYKLALFERFRLSSQLLTADRALVKLRSIKSDHPYFKEIQFEIVNCLRRCWIESDGDQSSQDHYLGQLIQADKQFRAMPELEAERQIDSLLIVVDVALKSGKETVNIDSIMEQTEEVLKSVPEDSKQHFAVLFFRFLHARKIGAWRTAVGFADVLAVNSTVKPHRVAALAFLADQFDRDPQIKPSLSKTKIYELMVDELGTTIETLRTSKNARVAATRLVESYVESGTSFESAKEINDKLLTVSPNQRNLLLNSARIFMHTGETNSALKVWRKIVQSARPGDDIWFESKLGIIKCLTGSNPEHASKVLRQTANLAGEIPEHWTNEFNQLRNVLLQADPNK